MPVEFVEIVETAQIMKRDTITRRQKILLPAATQLEVRSASKSDT